MLPGDDNPSLQAFRQARWQAAVQQVWARLTGRPSDLLCYTEVRGLLVPQGSHSIGYRRVPLAAIVGSVERCSDYTRGFLPLKDSDQRRWMSVKTAFAEARPLPAVDLFNSRSHYTEKL